MAAKCPKHLEEQFISDVMSGMTYKQLAEKYKRTTRTIGEWKRKLRENGRLPEPDENVTGDTLRFREVGNYAEASSQGERIQTLDQLLEAAEVNLDTWQVKDWGVKKWEVGAKIKLADIQYDQGKADGWIQHRGLGIQDLWSVWAKFIRREPIAICPAVRPVECPISYNQGKAQQSNEIQRALLISDLHIGYKRDNRTSKLHPFHDRRAIDAALQIAAGRDNKNWLFDYIAIAGDLLDLTNWNDKYSRSPEFYWTTQPAILEAHWILRALREAAPQAKIILMLGNHENRVRRSLEKHLLEAYGLHAADEMDLPPALSVSRLLALHKLGIESIEDYPSGETWLGPLRVTHGDIARQPPGASARAVVEDTTCDNAFGHTHRLEMVSMRVRTRKGVQVFKALSIGCLCHVDGRVPPIGSPEHWQQGMAVVNFTEDTWTPTLIGVNNGQVIWNDAIYQGRDYTEALRRDLPDWNW